MKFGLSDNTIERIQKVFESYSKIDEGILFGSRAKGNYKEGSDIDLAVKGRSISFDDILKLNGQLEDLNLPYKIDLLDYATIKDKDVVEHIDRVGIVFYERWKKYKFSDLMKLYGGGTPKTTVSEYWGGDIPWLSVTDFNNGKKYCFDAEKKITEKGFKESSTKILKKGQIIISARGTVGVVSMLGKDMAFNQSNYGIDANKDITSNDFLYYLLKNNISTFISNSYGAVFDTITKDTFDQISISVPPLKEQIAIVSTLNSLDDKIDLLHHQNKTLEQLAETLFRQWFVEEANESWETNTLSQHIEVFRGLSYKGSGLSETEGMPMHNLNSVFEFGGYKRDGIKFYIGEYRDRHLLNAGDIIVTNTEQGHEFRLIGFPAIVPDSFGSSGLFTQHIYRLTLFKDTYLTNQFIYYLLMTQEMRQQIVGATNGSTVNMLAIDGLQIPEFKLPSKEKVLQFSIIVKDYWNKKDSNYKQIKQLTQLRDALLPKLMSGEVRVLNN